MKSSILIVLAIGFAGFGALEVAAPGRLAQRCREAQSLTRQIELVGARQAQQAGPHEQQKGDHRRHGITRQAEERNIAIAAVGKGSSWLQGESPELDLPCAFEDCAHMIRITDGYASGGDDRVCFNCGLIQRLSEGFRGISRPHHQRDPNGQGGSGGGNREGRAVVYLPWCKFRVRRPQFVSCRDYGDAGRRAYEDVRDACRSEERNAPCVQSAAEIEEPLPDMDVSACVAHEASADRSFFEANTRCLDDGILLRDNRVSANRYGRAGEDACAFSWTDFTRWSSSCEDGLDDP